MEIRYNICYRQLTNDSFDVEKSYMVKVVTYYNTGIPEPYNRGMKTLMSSNGNLASISNGGPMYKSLRSLCITVRRVPIIREHISCALPMNRPM